MLPHKGIIICILWTYMLNHAYMLIVFAPAKGSIACLLLCIEQKSSIAISVDCRKPRSRYVRVYSQTLKLLKWFSAFLVPPKGTVWKSWMQYHASAAEDCCKRNVHYMSITHVWVDPMGTSWCKAARTCIFPRTEERSALLPGWLVSGTCHRAPWYTSVLCQPKMPSQRGKSWIAFCSRL